MANTMSKYGSNTNRPLSEIVGLSTDTKPTDSIEGIQIQNGSSFRELDTGKIFLFDAENTTWNEVSSGGGGGGSTLIEKSISANGVYNASDDSADGYSKVTVDVPSGGGSSQPRKDVNFYDYDGTIVNSYTAAEFANLSAMPANPSHDGLTAQGWNWSLSDAKSYVTSYGKLEIGQMYITSDGKTKLYILLTEGRTSPVLQLYLNANSELDIDWGDGTTHSTFTSTTADFVSERHNYASEGNYVIALTVTTGNFKLRTSTTSVSSILWNENNNASSPDIAYANSIKKIEIGTDMVGIGDNAFQNCYSLTSITIPNSVTNIGKGAFSSCYSLTSITIPSSVTNIGNSTFQSCSSLTSITIPNTITAIGQYIFQACSSLTSITLPNTITSIERNSCAYCSSLTSITLPNTITAIGNSAFSSCYSLTSITIPNSVTMLGSNVFQYCYSLATIIIDKAEGSISGSPWGAVTGSPTSTQIIWTG